MRTTALFQHAVPAILLLGGLISTSVSAEDGSANAATAVDLSAAAPSKFDPAPGWPMVSGPYGNFNPRQYDLPGREKDVALMTDLLRWCEDRAVDWQRKEDPKLVYPRFVVGGGHNSFTQNGSHMRLALAYARLATLTGNPLHRAKAEALAGSIVVSQNPVTGQIGTVTGQISDTFPIDPALSGSGDGGNRGEFAGRALMRLAQLWEGLPPIGQRPAK